jgi:predicted nucleic acid-binding Zn ribbon protein
VTGRERRLPSGWRPLPSARAGAGPRRISDSIDGVTRRLGAPPATALGTLFGRWAEVVGEAAAAHSRPVSLVGQVLTVAVDEPGWATQLRYLGSEVVARLTDLLGPGVVARVEVHVDRPGRGRSGGRAGR